MIVKPRARGEMDITTGFGPVIVGSSPAERAMRTGEGFRVGEVHTRSILYAASERCGYCSGFRKIACRGLATRKSGSLFQGCTKTSNCYCGGNGLEDCPGCQNGRRPFPK